MRILVQKFGGTSVKDVACQRQVLEKVKRGLADGCKVVVVLSARSGRTDRLLERAREWSHTPDPAELDALVVTGEQESVALFAMLCIDEGIKARSVLNFQVPILTNDKFTRARIEDIDSKNLLALLEDYDVLVAAGFQGVTREGRVTTLGRGGSDTSAVALAAALGPCECDIYTDVDGVYTTDPRICSKARKLDKISFDEMLELASQGAKVLQIRSVEFAKKYNVPLRLRSTFSDDLGTLVTCEDQDMMESLVVTGIALDKDQCRYTLEDVQDRPGIAMSIFKALADAGVSVDMIVQNTSKEGVTDMTFTISRKDMQKADAVLGEVAKRIDAAAFMHDQNVCKVSVVGIGMRNHLGVAAKTFEALAKENVNILMISTSEIKITCLIDEKYAELAVRTLHDAFELDKAPQKAASACKTSQP